MTPPPPIKSHSSSWLGSESAQEAGRLAILAAGALLILFGLSGMSLKANNETGADEGTNLIAEISRAESKTQLGLGIAIAGYAITMTTSKKPE